MRYNNQSATRFELDGLLMDKGISADRGQKASSKTRALQYTW